MDQNSIGQLGETRSKDGSEIQDEKYPELTCGPPTNLSDLSSVGSSARELAPGFFASMQQYNIRYDRGIT